MIAEEKKQAVLAAIERMEDEAAFDKIAAVVNTLLAESETVKQLAAPGFAAGPNFWMAADFDEPLEDFKDYQ